MYQHRRDPRLSLQEDSIHDRSRSGPAAAVTQRLSQQGGRLPDSALRAANVGNSQAILREAELLDVAVGRSYSVDQLERVEFVDVDYAICPSYGKEPTVGTCSECLTIRTETLYLLVGKRVQESKITVEICHGE